jgi:hypothetical protein
VQGVKVNNFVGSNYAQTPATLNGGVADVFVFTRPISSSEVTYLYQNIAGTIITTSDTSQTSSVSGTITGLTKNKYYGLNVTATNANGTSFSQSVQVYTPPVPDPPTALTVGTATNTSIAYTFTPPATLPFWYDISAVTGSTVAYTSRLYPATCSGLVVGTGTSVLTGLTSLNLNLGLCITAAGYYRLALFSQYTANTLYAIRIINGVWGTPVLVNISYNVPSSATTPVISGLSITPDGKRCIITTGTYFSLGTADNFIYWADMRPLLYGSTNKISFTRIGDATGRQISTVAISTDGMRLIAAAYAASGQVYLSVWNGSNYGALTAIASGTGSYIGTGMSYDGKYIAYGKTNTAIYYSTWNGSTYTGETSIGSITYDPRSITFTYGAPYGIFISTQGTSNVAYTTTWNGTGFSALSSANTTN